MPICVRTPAGWVLDYSNDTLWSDYISIATPLDAVMLNISDAALEPFNNYGIYTVQDLALADPEAVCP